MHITERRNLNERESLRQRSELWYLGENFSTRLIYSGSCKNTFTRIRTTASPNWRNDLCKYFSHNFRSSLELTNARLTRIAETFHCIIGGTIHRLNCLLVDVVASAGWRSPFSSPHLIIRVSLCEFSSSSSFLPGSGCFAVVVVVELQYVVIVSVRS